MTDAQRAALAHGRSLGGKALRNKIPPERCPLCQRPTRTQGTQSRWHMYLGHLSVHHYAANRGLSYEEGFKQLTLKGLAAGDPMPGNGAWGPGQSFGRME